MDSNKCNNKLKYTINDLKRDFGINNVIEEKTDSISYASVDVALKNNKINVIKELERAGLILFGANRINCDNRLFLLSEHPGHNICTITEYNQPGDFSIVIQQSSVIRVENTIVFYVSFRGVHYQLNHWDK